MLEQALRSCGTTALPVCLVLVFKDVSTQLPAPDGCKLLAAMPLLQYDGLLHRWNQKLKQMLPSIDCSAHDILSQ